VPEAAVALAVRLRVVAPVELSGLKEAVTPLGKPLAEKATVPAKPLEGTTVIVEVALELCWMVKLLGAAVRLKSGAEFTLRFTVAV